MSRGKVSWERKGEIRKKKKKMSSQSKRRSESVTVAVIDSSHTVPEVTCLWEKASSLMTGENSEEAAFSGLSVAVNYLRTAAL